MKKNVIAYKGETNGVHNWASKLGTNYYWHQSWQHIAEDQMGIKSHQDLNIDEKQDLSMEQIEDKISEHADHKE